MADDRLRKLVLMLSSDQPGEVAAAARAIGKTLKAEGRDWNWLAAKLADDEAPELRPEAAEGPWERREPPPPSEAPRYAEPEQEEAPQPRAGPWGNPTALTQWTVLTQWGSLRWFLFAAFVVASALGGRRYGGEVGPVGVALALLGIGLILWGCVWLLGEIATAARAVSRWFSRSRA